jgi:hypothetical protein
MDTTSNSASIQADAFFVWDPASRKHVNLQSSITGLAPGTLNSLNELAIAVGNDPNFANNLQATTSGLQDQVDAKADAFILSSPLLWNFDPAHPEIVELTADCYTKADTDVVTRRVDTLEYAVYNEKADKFTVGAPLLWDPAFGHQITADCYTKVEVTTALNLKATIESPTFTGTVGGLTKNSVQLGNVDNTADSAKVVSDLTQTALNSKATIESPTFTGTVGGLTKSSVQFGNVDNTADSVKVVSGPTQTALTLKATIESPTFTGTVGGLTKNAVQLGNVDNTADSVKVVSGPTQTALDLKTNTSVTNNSSVAWSEGLVGVYHFLNTGTDALVVRTNSGTISANFLGNIGGSATDGKVIFYKDFEVGEIKT